MRTSIKFVKLILKTCLKFLLILPILLGMVLLNLKIDRSGLFHSIEYETSLAQAIITNQNLAGYDQMDERKVYEEIARMIETPYDTLAFGSSRILQLRQETVGGTFLNCGMSNADYRDIMGTFYLFDRAGKLPKNVIIGLDPTLFCSSTDVLHKDADNNLFEEFLTTRLGLETSYIPKAEDKNAKLKALLSPSYFQANLKYITSGKENIVQEPTTVTQNLDNQPTNVKLSDGSVLYKHEFRMMSKADLAERARTDSYWFQRLNGFNKLDLNLLHLFDTFVQYMQSKGINVSFVLPPFHPLAFYYVTEHKELMPAFFEMELWCRQYAAANKVALYGSYNPFVGDGFSEQDFYDGLHIKPDALGRIFPGVQQMAQDIASGAPTSPLLYGGQTVSRSTAQYFTAQRYEVSPPEELRQLNDGLVEGINSYIFGYYSSVEEDAVLKARYAVTKDTGLVYRLDTAVEPGRWVIDPRF